MGIALLYHGLSCRQTAEVLSFFDEASYEAARQWYHRAKALLREPSKRHRPLIAIDETKMKVERWWYFIWAAVDTENRAESCSAWKSRRRERGAMPPSRFIRRVLKTCTNEHAESARGRRPWYPGALSRMGVP